MYVALFGERIGLDDKAASFINYVPISMVFVGVGVGATYGANDRACNLELPSPSAGTRERPVLRMAALHVLKIPIEFCRLLWLHSCGVAQICCCFTARCTAYAAKKS